ncbi:MAG: sulfatase-like hydrolase/transferase [Saccharofermentans sp.]|nr:sulfatase-like hydrolase/transferase [Saccharofermentans sp.]
MKKKLLTILKYILIFLGVFVAAILITAMLWTMQIWRYITFDEIVYHLFAPIKGTNPDVIYSFLLRALLPAVIGAAAVTTFKILVDLDCFKLKKHVKMINKSILVTLFAGVTVMGLFFGDQYDVIGYFMAKGEDSTFIEDNYVDPKNISVIFPSQKRNLIYIFCESMEMTYTDEAHGGGFDENYIPNLTNMALDPNNDCFNGSTGVLNGAVPLHGATFTSGGMVAQTAGLPAMEEIGNAAGTQSSFYPGATSIGDILMSQGYNQELMVGSDAVFGGRQQYFQGHGNYKIFDYNYAEQNGYIPRGYKVWWGFEDDKLFDFARQEILNLASSDKPFNFTMLTVDTHFEDGWVCPDCTDEFGDNQYANVIACSDRKLAEFVSWIQEQPFYENTTIVICGDHTTMDSNFCAHVDNNYLRRTYCTVINSAATGGLAGNSMKSRTFSTFDMFPTTLAAMGCEIEGNRLGLGVNLYSDEETLLEQYGVQYCNTELARNSVFLKENISRFEPFDREVYDTNSVLDVEYTPQADPVQGTFDSVNISIGGLETADEPIKAVELKITKNAGIEVLGTYNMIRMPDLTYNASFDVSGLKDTDIITLTVTVTDNEGVKHIVFKDTEHFANIEYYLSLNIDQYLNYYLGMDNVVLLGAASDEASLHLQPSTLEILRNAGLEAALDEHIRLSWYGVVSDGEVIEEDCSEDLIGIRRELPDGTPYLIASSNFNTGSGCAIRIDHRDYADSQRGLSFAVYDLDTHRVISAANFDTFKKSYTGVSGGEVHLDTTFFGSRLNVNIDHLINDINFNNTGTADLYVWDASTIGSPAHYAMDLTENSYGKSIPIGDFDMDTLYISIYIKKAGGKILVRHTVKVTDFLEQEEVPEVVSAAYVPKGSSRKWESAGDIAVI